MTYIARNTPEEDTALRRQELNGVVQHNASFADQPSAKSLLLIGLVTGTLVFCTIGFFVLVILFIKGGG